jgi:hypothetical protein
MGSEKGFIRRFRTAWAFASGRAELVWTSKGNLPAHELERQVNWEFAPSYLVHKETYRHKSEVVKSSADVYQLPAGMVFNTQTGFLNQPRTDGT